jgi:hypothetical protein
MSCHPQPVLVSYPPIRSPVDLEEQKDGKRSTTAGLEPAPPKGFDIIDMNVYGNIHPSFESNAVTTLLRCLD